MSDAEQVPQRSARQFFLGGRDLEMVTIRELLDRQAPGQVHDAGLAWGAKASAYQEAIDAALKGNDSVVLVELEDDLGLLDGPNAGRIISIDHHGQSAGLSRPTALEQVFHLLALPENEWSRWYRLVAANDRGHLRAMKQAGATHEEMVKVRAADRAAQAITAEQEQAGKAAAMASTHKFDGALTIVDLPHSRTATVTDFLDRELGGPGYENLLVFCPDSVMFYGRGRAIESLRKQFPDGFYGGELPQRGFWGHPSPLPRHEVLAVFRKSNL